MRSIGTGSRLSTRGALLELGGHESRSSPQFIARGFTGQSEPPGRTHLRGNFAAVLFLQSSGEILCPRANKLIIEQREGLRSNGGIFAGTATGLGIGSIESLHEGILHHAFVEDINRTAARGWS